MVKYCDICKKQLPIKESLTDDEDEGTELKFPYHKYDLCSECTEKVRQFIETSATEVKKVNN